jgi:hypothetical protein
MKTRIGLIGPEDSLARIVRAASRFADRVELVPRVYSDKRESIKLAKELDSLVDVILFSGIIPYRIVHNANAIETPCLFIPRVGTSVIRPLWEMRNKGECFDRVSIDSIFREDVEEAVEEFGFTFKSLEVLLYEEDTSYEALAEMHAALYLEGRTDVAMTGLTKTHSILAGMGVPSYKIYPDKYIIREYLQKAIYISEAAKLKSYQIAIIIFRLRSGSASIATEYDYLRIKNSFESMLIDYAKGIYSSMFPSGHDEYILYTTRGTLDEDQGLRTLLKSANNSRIEFSGGLGFGATAFNAEANARKALDRSCSTPESSMFSVDVDGTIAGPLASPGQTLEYKLSDTSEEVRNTARESGLSTSYLTKIRSLIKVTKKTRFDVEELAAGLGISARSARRILQGIAEAGKAEIVALESKSRTGRPRRLYDLKI